MERIIKADIDESHTLYATFKLTGEFGTVVYKDIDIAACKPTRRNDLREKFIGKDILKLKEQE